MYMPSTKATGIVRKVDTLGRIVIPGELRKTFNIQINDPLAIYINDNNEIILKKYEPACIFCGKNENVFTFSDKVVCKKCAEKLNNI